MEEDEIVNPNDVGTESFSQRGTIFPSGDTTINDIFREQGHGSFSALNTAALWGVDHQGISTYIDSPQEEYGIVLFTKPMLNLSYNNILQDNRFVAMASDNALSMPRIVKAMLDPVSQKVKRTSCPLIDPYSAFLPILSNTCTSLSGFPDIQMKSYESAPGKFSEVYIQPDGHAETMEDLSLTATFKEGPGGIVSELFFKWVTYMGLIREGKFRRRLGFILDNKRDYDTRVYVLVLDRSKRYVLKLTCCGVMFPSSVPMGKDGDFVKEADGGIIEDSNTVSIQFKAMGACYRNPLWIAAFNRTVENMNPYMNVAYIKTYMKQIPHDQRNDFNKMGYPLIDIATMELKWYVFKEDYEIGMNRRKRSGL